MKNGNEVAEAGRRKEGEVKYNEGSDER